MLVGVKPDPFSHAALAPPASGSIWKEFGHCVIDIEAIDPGVS
jgi:hypothetical protein